MVSFFMFFTICCIVTIILFIKKRHLDKAGVRPSLGYHFLKNSLELLCLFLLASLTYLMLFVFVMAASEYASLQFLVRLEGFLDTVKSYFSRLKLSELTVLGVLVIVYLLGWLRLPSEKSKGLLKLFGKYQTATKRVYVFLILLCSFTLLGTHFGEPTTDLRVRIKLIRDGYADISDDIRKAVPEEITAKMYARVLDSLPPDYRRGIGSAVLIQSERVSLREEYKSARDRYGIRLRKVESVLAPSSSGRTSSDNKIDSVKRQVSGTLPDPQKISYKKVKDTKASIDQQRAASMVKLDQLIKMEGGQEIVQQVPKVLMGQAKSIILGPLMQRSPLLEPVISVFIDTINDEMVTKVQKACERVDRSVIQNSNTLQDVIDTESSRVLEGKSIRVSSKSIEKAHRTSARIARQLAELRNARAQIPAEVARIENKKTMAIISQLKSPNEQKRIEAVNQLVGMGEKLSKSQVDEVLRIMRHGTEKWSKSLGRIEGHHCEDFEHVSVKYYAADAIMQMKSQHVDKVVVEEAGKIKEAGIKHESVTDPGWV